MRQVAPQLIAAAASGGAASNEPLVVLVDRTGREAGLGGAIRDQSPAGEHSLRLRLEAASFDAVVAWLASLQQQHGVRVDAATIQRHRRTGARQRQPHAQQWRDARFLNVRAGPRRRSPDALGG